MASLLQPAVKIAAAGLGAVIAGPLGGALGGLLGDALGGQSSELIRKYADKFGDKAAEKLVDQGQDKLLERLKAEAPRLEKAYRVALAASLKGLRPGSSIVYADWFDHWDKCLGSEETLTLAGMEDMRVPDAASIDHLLERLLIRLDAQGSALASGSIAISLTERSMPADLSASLHQKLPEKFRESFHTVIVSESYRGAWRELELACQERMEQLLVSMDGKLDKADAKIDAVMAGQGALSAKLDALFDQQKQNAIDQHRIEQEATRADEAEKERDRWKQKFLELEKQSVSLKQLLETGDLAAAAQVKQREIVDQDHQQAKNYFELGTIQDLRFDFAAALEAYSKAWRLEQNPLFGFRVAGTLAMQNRHDEAIVIYRQLLRTFTSQEDIAAVLNNMGAALRATLMLTEAEQSYRMAVQIYRSLAQTDVTYRTKLADTLGNLGATLTQAKRPKEAYACLDEAFTIHLELVKMDVRRHLPGAAATATNFGVLMQGMGMSTDALKAFNQAIDWYTYLSVGERKRFLPAMANVLLNRGATLLELKRIDEAERDLIAAVGGFRWLCARQRAAHLPGLAKALTNLGTLYHHSDFEKAKELNSEALACFIELNGKSSQSFLLECARAHTNLASCCYSLDQYDEAESNCTRAEELLENLWKEAPEIYGDQFGQCLGLRAAIWRRQGRDRAEVCVKAKEGLTAARSEKVRIFLQSVVNDLCGPA